MSTKSRSRHENYDRDNRKRQHRHSTTSSENSEHDSKSRKPKSSKKSRRSHSPPREKPCYDDFDLPSRDQINIEETKSDHKNKHWDLSDGNKHYLKDKREKSRNQDEKYSSKNTKSKYDDEDESYVKKMKKDHKSYKSENYNKNERSYSKDRSREDKIKYKDFEINDDNDQFSKDDDDYEKRRKSNKNQDDKYKKDYKKKGEDTDSSKKNYRKEKDDFHRNVSDNEDDNSRRDSKKRHNDYEDEVQKEKRDHRKHDNDYDLKKERTRDFVQKDYYKKKYRNEVDDDEYEQLKNTKENYKESKNKKSKQKATSKEMSDETSEESDDNYSRNLHKKDKDVNNTDEEKSKMGKRKHAETRNDKSRKDKKDKKRDYEKHEERSKDSKKEKSKREYDDKDNKKERSDTENKENSQRKKNKKQKYQKNSSDYEEGMISSSEDDNTENVKNIENISSDKAEKNRDRNDRESRRDYYESRNSRRERSRNRRDNYSDKGYNYQKSGSPGYRQRYNYNQEDRRNRAEDEMVSNRYWGDLESQKKAHFKNNYEDDNTIQVGERFYGGPRKEKDSQGNTKDYENDTPKEEIPASQKRTVDILTSRTGGAYIPPAKLKLMQAEITNKTGAAYQRIAWEALKKSIHGYINKVNTSNIGLITRELLRENIIRGRGLLARSIIQAQAASPTFTPVYAALTAVINSRFPNIGELILIRLATQFKRGFRRNDKTLCISSSTFIAHLINQRVAHEILALEILTLLGDTPTDDSIEVAISFLKECGMRLTEISKKGITSIFEMLRNILHEGKLDKRVQYMIEVMFQIRKDGFKDHVAVPDELDLVEEENQFTHIVTLDEATDSQDILNVFKFDPEYQQNEDKYKNLIKDALDLDSDGSEESGDEFDSDEEESEEEGDEESKADVIKDMTETNLTALRRTIYLTIHSSLDFEECAHKIMKMQLKPGQEMELCHMCLDCCAEMRTYEKFYGQLAGRFCAINKMFVTPFEKIFQDSYDTVHRLDTNKLRNVSKFFAFLLYTDSISWEVLTCIKLNEEDTTSSSRIFIKILFQELCEYMGLTKLNLRVKEPALQEAFAGLFPKDDPTNTRFAINFFTSIGLGGLTNDLREHLKTKPKATPAVKDEDQDSSSEDSSSSSSSSSSSDSD